MNFRIAILFAAVFMAGCQSQVSSQVKGDSADQTDSVAVTNPETAASAEEIFQSRLLPIFQSPKPSSCTECHLSGVELKSYIRSSQEETFASLVKHGMINVESPEESKILTFIERKPEAGELVTQKIRDEEYAAFKSWIIAACNDPNVLAAKPDDSQIGPQVSDKVIRHARTDRVLASFVENVWTEVGRCAACHSPDQNQEQVKKHGEQVSWIQLNSPQETLNYMIDADIISVDDPEQSLLLLKPTMQVEHGGGQKMVIGDRTYKQFRRFIDDYAAVTSGKYKTATELPEPAGELSVVTDIWLKIENVPDKYDKMLLQVDLYAAEGEGWSKVRVATSDRPVYGGGNLWQHSLSLTAPRNSPRADQLNSKKLPHGRYLAKIYIDKSEKLKADFKAELDADDFIGDVELESQWPGGYGRMTVISFPE